MHKYPREWLTLIKNTIALAANKGGTNRVEILHIEFLTDAEKLGMLLEEVE